MGDVEEFFNGKKNDAVNIGGKYRVSKELSKHGVTEEGIKEVALHRSCYWCGFPLYLKFNYKCVGT